MAPVPAIFARISSVLLAVTHVLAPIPPILDAIAQTTVVSCIAPVFTPVSYVLALIAPVLPAIPHVLQPVAHTYRTTYPLLRFTHRGSGDKKQTGNGNNMKAVPHNSLS